MSTTDERHAGAAGMASLLAGLFGCAAAPAQIAAAIEDELPRAITVRAGPEHIVGAMDCLHAVAAELAAIAGQRRDENREAA